MKLFTVRCHVHPDGTDPDCRECLTAFDVNVQGHRAGTCIPASCWWHAAEAEAARLPQETAGAR